jgi:flagellar hook-length control protein FliK
LKAMIERIALDALALRSQLPDLRLREGASVVARVAARQAEHGVIVLAGAPLVAKLPPEIEAGQTLHLKVAEVTPEQVTLRLDQTAMLAQQQAQPAPPPELRAPHLTLGEPPRRGASGDESATMTLAFDSALLGRLDLRIDLARGTVSARVDAPPGAALELAESAAGRLRDALAETTGRTAQVTVVPRRDPFDAYA